MCLRGNYICIPAERVKARDTRSVNSSAKASALFRAAWLVVGIALCGSLAVWGNTIAAHVAGPMAPSPVPTPPRAGLIVTTYSPTNAIEREQLCDELSPRVQTVTVESTSGKVITTLDC
jgi:hypothetical protein